jgi:hypothetical protein
MPKKSCSTNEKTRTFYAAHSEVCGHGMWKSYQRTRILFFTRKSWKSKGIKVILKGNRHVVFIEWHPKYVQVCEWENMTPWLSFCNTLSATVREDDLPPFLVRLSQSCWWPGYRIVQAGEARRAAGCSWCHRRCTTTRRVRPHLETWTGFFLLTIFVLYKLWK